MLPIFILQNGVADKSDRYRAPFIVAHLQQVKRAIDNGATVIGYLHWSFMDNYEWLENYRAESKFGLFRIDFGSTNNQFDLARQRTKGGPVRHRRCFILSTGWTVRLKNLARFIHRSSIMHKIRA
jgi:beta-glucosidase/6-phospho-beta-glucosidase/beta-galactosidase